MLNHICSSAPAPYISCDMLPWCLPLHALYIIKIHHTSLIQWQPTADSWMVYLPFVLGSTQRKQSSREMRGYQDREWEDFLTDIAPHLSIKNFTNHQLPGRSNWSLTHIFWFARPGFWPCFRHCTLWAGTGYLSALLAEANLTVVIIIAQSDTSPSEKLIVCGTLLCLKDTSNCTVWAVRIYSFHSTGKILFWIYLRIQYKCIQIFYFFYRR